MILRTPKWSLINAQLFFSMECEGEETLLFNFLEGKKCVFSLLSEDIAEVLTTSLMLKVVATRLNKTDISRYSKDNKHHLVRTHILHIFFKYFLLSFVLYLCSKNTKFEITQTLGNLFANAFGLFCHTFLSVWISTIRSAQQDKCLSLTSAGVKYMTIFKKHVMGCSYVQINPVTVCCSAHNLHNSVSPAMYFLRHRVLEFNW